MVRFLHSYIDRNMSYFTESCCIESLPDDLLLLILNKITDVKNVACFAASSRRFRSLLQKVENVVIKVDCMVPDGDAISSISKSHTSRAFSRLLHCRFMQTLGLWLGSNRTSRADWANNTTLHHSPAEVLRDFTNVKSLRIDLPSPELRLDDSFLLKWRASFGSTLNNCVILGATSIVSSSSSSDVSDETSVLADMRFYDESDVMPQSFYANGYLRSRVVWMIGALTAASTRHYLVQSIIEEHKTIQSLVISDEYRQGILHMGREQLEETRVMKSSVSLSSKRTVVPDLEMRLWYATRIELSDGSVLMGVTLGAVWPKEKIALKEKFLYGDWVAAAFEEPFASAAKILVKGRSYSVDMNSF